MKALVIKGTTWSGKIINAGETHEMPDDVFRLFKLAGQCVEAPEDNPAEVAAPEPAPTKAPQRKIKKKR